MGKNADCSITLIWVVVVLDRLMHILFVTQNLDYRCLTTEVERMEPIVHRTEDILGEDTKIICAEQARNQERIELCHIWEIEVPSICSRLQCCSHILTVALVGDGERGGSPTRYAVLVAKLRHENMVSISPDSVRNPFNDSCRKIKQHNNLIWLYDISRISTMWLRTRKFVCIGSETPSAAYIAAVLEYW